MIDQKVQQELLEHLSRLPTEAQREVAEFARGLAAQRSTGEAGSNLFCFAGTIAQSDLKAMAEAIEEACQKVDHSQL